MQCEAFERQLNELVDNRQSPAADASVIAHAQRCSKCSGLLAGYETLFDALEMRAEAEPPEKLGERVVARLNRRSALPWSVKLAASLAVAAGLLVATMLATRAPHRHAPAPLPQHEPLAVTVEPPAEPNPAHEEYLVVFRLTGKAMATLPNTVRHAAATSELQPVAEGIRRPLANSLSAALDAIWQVFPGATPDVESSSSWRAMQPGTAIV